MGERFFYAGNIGHYMGIASELLAHMDTRALLTEREREVLRGEDVEDIENLSQYRSKIRTRIKRRLKILDEDLDILEAHEPDLAADLTDTICGDKHDRLARLEREVAELRARIENTD